MAKQFQIGLPPTTGEAAVAFVKSLDQQIVELEEQLKLLRQVKTAIQATFPPHEAWIAAEVINA
jgi:hypothetical protein